MHTCIHTFWILICFMLSGNLVLYNFKNKSRYFPLAFLLTDIVLSTWNTHLLLRAPPSALFSLTQSFTKVRPVGGVCPGKQ